MNCPYCGVSFKNNVSFYSEVYSDACGEHNAICVYCTECNKPIVLLESSLEIKAPKDTLDKEQVSLVEDFYDTKVNPKPSFSGPYQHLSKFKQIKPESTYRNPIPKEVTDLDVIQDYHEACLTLEISVRASAALSRRCLQSILEKNNPNLKSTQLNKQIEEVINTQNLPSSVTELLHAVREIGNISVHPIKNINSNAIIKTSLEEAELNLEVIESLFDYYYVMPAKNAERKNRLNQKLAQVGRKTV